MSQVCPRGMFFPSNVLRGYRPLRLMTTLERTIILLLFPSLSTSTLVEPNHFLVEIDTVVFASFNPLELLYSIEFFESETPVPPRKWRRYRHIAMKDDRDRISHPFIVERKCNSRQLGQMYRQRPYLPSNQSSHRLQLDMVLQKSIHLGSIAKDPSKTPDR